MLTSLENECEIVLRCQQGDVEAYQVLYHHFAQPLLRLGLRLLGQQEDAEDAVQMAFIRLYHTIDRFQFRSSLGTYLFRIMVNVCFDALRQKKQRRIRALENTDSVYQSQDELRLELEKSIAILPERMRTCFVLFAVEGFKHHEIAEIMGLSVGTVKAHVFQAKTRLRVLLSGGGNGCSHEM